MQLTANFSLEELTASQTAARKNIENEPDDVQLSNLRRLAYMLQEIRNYFDVPIFINSGFRCKALNRAVGSKDTSQHMKGCAADIRISGVSPSLAVAKIIESGISYDQVICEYDSWVHISVPNEVGIPARKKALIIDKHGVRSFS
jgi:zinc D-Ala-D-Ala carboxypeptidase|tara:strand:- start:4018 stop:4452 length:435 start_codon:yes stop_codon:yes gene_type:complete